MTRLLLLFFSIIFSKKKYEMSEQEYLNQIQMNELTNKMVDRKSFYNKIM